MDSDSDCSFHPLHDIPPSGNDNTYPSWSFRPSIYDDKKTPVQTHYCCFIGCILCTLPCLPRTCFTNNWQCLCWYCSLCNE